jgi:hypothetical protein
MVKVWNKGSSLITLNLNGNQYAVPAKSYAEVPSGYLSTLESYSKTFTDLELDLTGGDISLSQIDEKAISCKFYGPIVNTASTLIAARTTTDAAANAIRLGDGLIAHTVNIGAQTAAPGENNDGLGIGCDQTNGDGLELNFGSGITLKGINQFKMTEEVFHAGLSVSIGTVAGVAKGIFGFRKAEAHQADLDNYNDLVAIDLKAGAINIEYINNNAATVTTDTTKTVADGLFYDLLVIKDDNRALNAAITLANDIKSKYNLHLANSLAHTTSPDNVNLVSTTDASNLTTLLALTNALTTKYILHDDDAELAADWIFHAAQEAGDYSLAATTAVTTLLGALTRLKDMRSKLNSHIADTTAHGVATTLITATDVSNVFCFYKLSTEKTYTDISVGGTLLDVVTTVIPTFQYTHNATLGGAVILSEYFQDKGLPKNFKY